MLKVLVPQQDIDNLENSLKKLTLLTEYLGETKKIPNDCTIPSTFSERLHLLYIVNNAIQPIWYIKNKVYKKTLRYRIADFFKKL